jgi:hypothetical protein
VMTDQPRVSARGAAEMQFVFVFVGDEHDEPFLLTQ